MNTASGLVHEEVYVLVVMDITNIKYFNLEVTYNEKSNFPVGSVVSHGVS